MATELKKHMVTCKAEDRGAAGGGEVQGGEGMEVQWRGGDRAATVVGIPKISRYTDFFQNSVFLEAKGGALLYVQKSVKLGIFATFFLKSR